MPNIAIGKRLQSCISSILKRPSTLSQNTPGNPTIHHRRPTSTSSSSVPLAPANAEDACVFSNFNSLRDATSAESKSRVASTTTNYVHSSSGCSFSSAPEDSTTTPATRSTATTAETTTATTTKTIAELSAAIATRRLTLSSPGRSNSIVDSAEMGVGGIGVAVPTYSLDPYSEFRRSMEEMVAAMGVPVDGRREQQQQKMMMMKTKERLYELLVCYLALNNKRVHDDIVDAFVDLLSDLQIQSDGCA